MTALASRSCPCCGAALGSPAFVHPAVPVVLNVLAATADDARRAPTGRLELFECATCGGISNQAFAGVPYGPDYFLDAMRSPRYLRHLDDVTDRLASVMAGRPTFSVVDVGAGQGAFLVHLAERLGARVSRAHGFDPAFRAGGARLPANVCVTAAPLDESDGAALGFAVDVAVTRHVVEHVIDPVRFLASIRETLPGSFTLVVETPNVEHTVAHGLLHDFCYEHCMMMSATALATALQRAGYDRVRVELAFDGEYLLAFAVAPASPAVAAKAEAQATTRPPSARLADVAARFLTTHRDRLSRARARGPVALWGAAGKGALFAYLVDPDRELLEAVVDIHPSKQGMFLPGTGHSIVSPEEARRRGARTVFVANPTYCDEVAAQCATIGLHASVEPLGDSD